ncbi:hypothetical protein ILYODFUR_033064 [Ilyodon furcidens]|uniref:Uncharacterized protein n=1 Tax=Ilyodon furcidens TaxID=33524 RepID=A0ABV0VJU3_9TELE
MSSRKMLLHETEYSVRYASEVPFSVKFCTASHVSRQLDEKGQCCQATTGQPGGGRLTFSQSTFSVSPQWPAVELQLMCAPPCKAFIGSTPHTQLTWETRTQTYTLLWFFLARLSHGALTGVTPCYSRY